VATPSYAHVAKIDYGKPERFTGEGALNFSTSLNIIKRSVRLQNVPADRQIDFAATYLKEPASCTWDVHSMLEKGQDPFNWQSCEQCFTVCPWVFAP
jgi:hypothetical protein